MEKVANYKRSKTQSAWVVFTGQTDIFWLKALKSGFRHCYLLLNDGQRWLSVDPLSIYTDIEIYHHIEPSFALPEWLENQGYKVLKTSINATHKTPAPWAFFTCVEAIKRILGLHKRFIFTPWQLYKFIEKTNQKQNSQYLKGDFSWVV